MSSAFDNVVMVGADTEGVTVSAGGFKSKDANVFSTAFEKDICFPENWMHGTADGDEPFKVTATCRSILLAYKKTTADSFGTVEILVDGKVVKTVSGKEAGGWYSLDVNKIKFGDGHSKWSQLDYLEAEASIVDVHIDCGTSKDV